jgi:hypothetical protein
MSPLRSFGLVLATCAAVVACQTQGDEEQSSQDEGAVAVAAAETVPVLGKRIDRIGRPEVTNFVVRDPALKVLYNAEDSFDVSAEMLPKYIGAAKAAIAHYDGFDGPVADYDEKSTAALAAILVEDQLRIDVSKPCDASGASYFAAESAEMRGRKATTCGGRAPNEDVFDTLITYYINGPTKDAPTSGDGVGLASSTGPAGATFPYLVKPHLLRER